MKPSIISVHYTNRCERNCSHCYLKKQILENEVEICKEEWLKLPSIVSTENYIKKIAIAVNYYSLNSVDIKLESNFIFSFLKESLISNIAIDITTDPVMAKYMTESINVNNDKSFKIVDVFSISIDSNRYKNLSEINDLELLIKMIKSYGANSVNANFLLTKESVKWIEDGILEIMSSIFDTVHIIFEKPFTYTENEYYDIVEKLLRHDIFENSKYIIDPCILLKLELVSYCHNTMQIIDINSYGSISGCAYDHFDAEIDKINNMKDILKVLRCIDTGNKTKITGCKYLEFIDKP